MSAFKNCVVRDNEATGVELVAAPITEDTTLRDFNMGLCFSDCTVTAMPGTRLFNCLFERVRFAGERVMDANGCAFIDCSGDIPYPFGSPLTV